MNQPRSLIEIISDLPVDCAERLLESGKPEFARWVLRLPPSPSTDVLRRWKAKERASAECGLEQEYKQYRREVLHFQIKNSANSKNVEGTLGTLLVSEKEGIQAPLLAGRFLARKMLGPVGRGRMFAAAKSYLNEYPNSPFLVHLIGICQAMQGDYEEAGRWILDRLQSFDFSDCTNSGELVRRHHLFNTLGTCWRAIDLIARDDMRRLNVGAVSGSLHIYRRMNAKTDDGRTIERLFSFKEALLQGQFHDEYLSACDKEFYSSDLSELPQIGFHEKLRAVTDMLRQSKRHILNYRSAYDLAARRLAEFQDDWSRLLSDPDYSSTRPPHAVVRDLGNLSQLLNRLGRRSEAENILTSLWAMAQDEKFEGTKWQISAILARHSDYKDTAIEIGRAIPNAPTTERDIAACFSWALSVQDFQLADRVFKNLSSAQKRNRACLTFVDLLVRQSRFHEALTVAHGIHDQMISAPRMINAFGSWSLIKRIGELRFLRHTSDIYRKVEQPRDPVGLLVVAPRNVDQLRRYPLAVLVELKKMGWAIVSIVGGMFPLEKTGIEELDAITGNITLNGELQPIAENSLGSELSYSFEPSKGQLAYGELDLSHLLWEDAAINRRTYTVDYDCPALQEYLGHLAKWTYSEAITLSRLKEVTKKLNLKCGVFSLFGNRLPDGLVRQFCEVYGDEDRFFCVQGANGYQNYFANFATNYSSKYVVRNVTRHRHARSASFPLPENFSKFFEARRNEASEIISRHEGITRWKRSTAGRGAVSERTKADDRRIRSWRAGGGKVACAFGKVVYDSGVPVDGGPAHRSIEDWINHCISAVSGSNTLLLIKPHPHELNQSIATFPNQTFRELIQAEMGENVIYLEHGAFDIYDLKGRIDLGLIYNGTTAIELGVIGIPCILAGHYAPIDYPIGHAVPRDRGHFERLIRFESPIQVDGELRERAAAWLEYMSGEDFTLDYRYHARPITNRVVYPPWWFKDDLINLLEHGDQNVVRLARRAVGLEEEPA